MLWKAESALRYIPSRTALFKRPKTDNIHMLWNAESALRYIPSKTALFERPKTGTLAPRDLQLLICKKHSFLLKSLPVKMPSKSKILHNGSRSCLLSDKNK